MRTERVKSRRWSVAGLNAIAAGLVALSVVACKGSTEPAEDRGIYSETQLLFRDPDVFIGAFAGPVATSSIVLASDQTEKKEGSESLRATVRVSESGFAGWFVSWGDQSKAADDSYVRNMKGYKDGALVFWVRSPVGLEVGIRSGNVAAGQETSKVILTATNRFAADDAWHRACVPIGPLTGDRPKADLQRIKVLFVIASNLGSGGTGGKDRVFWVDDVRWQPSACPSS